MVKEKIIDLSMPINEKSPVYPGDPEPSIKQIANIKDNGWNEHRFEFNSHFTTHVDAPFHMIEKGKKLNDYPIEKFFGNGVLVDARYKPLDMELVKNYDISKGDIVLFCTNQSKKMYGNYTWGTKFISDDLAKFLIKKKVSMIGLDTFSPDKDPFPIHKMLLKRDILIIENLVDLDELIGKNFDVIALPLRLDTGDGATARVVARLK